MNNDNDLNLHSMTKLTNCRAGFATGWVACINKWSKLMDWRQLPLQGGGD